MGPSYQGFYLPKEMKTKSMGGVSKKVIGDVSSDMIMEATTTATEYWRTKYDLFTSFSCKLNREQIVELIRSNKTYNQITVTLVNPPLPGTRSSSPSPPIRPCWSFRASPPCRPRCKSDDLQWTKNHRKAKYMLKKWEKLSVILSLLLWCGTYTLKNASTHPPNL